MTEESTIPMWSLGDRLTKAREVAGITVSGMAKRLGVTRGTIGNYEHGRTTPNVATLMAWSQITGVPIWWLLDEREPTDRAASAGYPGQMSFTGLEFGLAA